MLRLMEGAFEMQPNSLNMKAEPGHQMQAAYPVRNWDSLTHMRMILDIENDFGIQFRTSQLTHLKSANDVFNELMYALSNFEDDKYKVDRASDVQYERLGRDYRERE